MMWLDQMARSILRRSDITDDQFGISTGAHHCRVDTQESVVAAVFRV
jgi:hypothetical protein